MCLVAGGRRKGLVAGGRRQGLVAGCWWLVAGHRRERSWVVAPGGVREAEGDLGGAGVGRAALGEDTAVLSRDLQLRQHLRTEGGTVLVAN